MENKRIYETFSGIQSNSNPKPKTRKKSRHEKYNESYNYYFDYLQQLRNRVNFQIPYIFDRPFENFILHNGDVVFIYEKINFKKLEEASVKIFKFKPDQLDLPWINELIRSLKELLKCLPNHVQLQFPYIYTTSQSFPFYQYNIINSNLYFVTSSNFRLICSDFAKTSKQFSLYKNLHRSLYKFDNIEMYTTMTGDNFFHCSINEELYRFDIEKDKCEKIHNRIISEHSPLRLSYSYISSIDSQDMYKYFYALCAGNFSTFKNFCMLISDYFILGNRSSHLYILRPSSINTVDDFCYDFHVLLTLHQVNLQITENFHTLCDSKFLKDYLRNFKRNSNGFHLLPQKTIPSETQHTTFKKLVNGRTVKIKDEFISSIDFTNRFPIVCTVNSDETFNYYKNNFNPKIIDFTHFSLNKIKESLIPLLNNNSKYLDSQVIFTLILLGMHFSTTPDSIKNQEFKAFIPHDEIIFSFIDTCTLGVTSGFTYLIDLYSAYECYYKAHHNGEPLTKKKFGDVIKVSGKYEYKRPHSSRNAPNRYAFVGLVLKTDWESELTTLNDKHDYSQEIFIDKIQKIVSTLPKYPIDLLKSEYISIRTVSTSSEPS